MNLIGFYLIQLLMLSGPLVSHDPGSKIGKPHLYKKISIPESLLAHSHDQKYGGDIRIGDLDNDKQIDFLIYRTIDLIDGGAPQPCFLAGMTMDGRVIWTKGEGGIQPNRPGPVAIHDIDADGKNEVITFFVKKKELISPHALTGMVLQILDGETGAVKAESSPDVLTTSEGEGPNWVHQRILIANLRGTLTPQDFIIKLGTKVIAFDNQLNVLWTYENEWNEYGNCPAYVPSVGDMDNDGKDEINGGYYVLNEKGRPMWEEKLGNHMDAVAIDFWDDPKMKRAFASGFGHVLDKKGEIILKLGEESVPHGQELRVGDFIGTSEGNEMAIRYNGHKTDVMVVGSNGAILSRFMINESPNNTGMETIRWNAETGTDLLYNGGMLWAGDGSSSIRLPQLPPEKGNFRQGWYHCIPANVAGNSSEEIIIYNPWDSEIFIYSNGIPDDSAYDGYVATPKQYNVRLID
tara:strand:- start:78766 stop:80154 length:1389 start_codon:yes stop_codon:yes gene_type:complete